MFGIGLPELAVIFIIGLIFIGPSKLPGVLRAIGKGLVEFKRATNDLKHSVEHEMEQYAEESRLKEIKNEIENSAEVVSSTLHSSQAPETLEKNLEKIAKAMENENKESSVR